MEWDRRKYRINGLSIIIDWKDRFHFLCCIEHIYGMSLYQIIGMRSYSSKGYYPYMHSVSFFSIEPIRRFQLSLTFVFILLRNFEVTRLWNLNQRFKHCYCDFRSTISFISVSLRYSLVAETDDISTYPSWVTFRILSYLWWHIKWRVTGHRGDVECRHEHFLPPSDPNRVSLEYEHGLEATFYPKIVCLSNCLGERIAPSSSSPPIATAACQIMISVNS